MVEAIVWALIVIAVVVFVIELTLDEHSRLAAALAWVDRVLLSLFAIELALRVLTYRLPSLTVFRRSLGRRVWAQISERLRYLLRPLQLIDLLTVLALVGPLRLLRALRLARLLRTAGRFRYSSPIRNLLRSFEENALLYFSAFTLLGLTVVVGGLTIYFAEHGTNDKLASISDGIWWALVTITTVGYGDIAPATSAGRVIGGAMMVMGMFTLALFAGIVGTSLLNVVLKLRQEQFLMSARANHIVICGYEEGSRLLLTSLLDEYRSEDVDLVIFAQGERPADFPPQFSWISGDPTKESELDKARLQAAAAVIVAASREAPPQYADATTALIVFTIRAYLAKHEVTAERRRPLYIIAEVLESENIEHARVSGADEVIQTQHLGFSLLAHSVNVRGTGQIMASLALSGAHNLYVGLNPFDEALPYGKLSQSVKERYQATVLGLQDRGGNAALSPGDDTMVGYDHGIIYLAPAAVLDAFEADEIG